MLWQVDAVTEVFTVNINIMMRRKVVSDDIVKSLNAEGIDHAILTLVSENYVNAGRRASAGYVVLL